MQRQSPAARSISIQQDYKNVLWFWPWSDVDCLSVVDKPETQPEWIISFVGTTNPSTYTRDLPYGWDTLIENLIAVATVDRVSPRDSVFRPACMSSRPDLFRANLDCAAKEGDDVDRFEQTTMPPDTVHWIVDVDTSLKIELVTDSSIHNEGRMQLLKASSHATMVHAMA